MASFYSSEGDMLPPSYILNQKIASYPSSQLASNDVSQPCVSLSYPNLLSESTVTRDETVFIPPTGVEQLNITPRYSDGNTVISHTQTFPKDSDGSDQIPQYHGLSLTLGNQEPSLMHLHSDLNHYTNSNMSSFLSCNMQSELQLPQEMSFVPPESITGTFGNSKYLKAAQQVLDELVSVHRAGPKLSEKVNAVGQDGSDVKRDGLSGESTNNASHDLSASERHELQNKLTKLLSMLDEVDKRYRQYCHQVQVVVSSFDMIAGRGAALPYTALARRTISCQFRCLRDAIKKQIQATQKSLGEQDVNSHGLGVLSRLRYVDQQLRQQKALQQFGVMRQPWRPQRGLPETAVSVLRAWLFEHFLHPYPKDSEKIVLARQTGLTRSQVANWFINARVRLWKPMIEEMYKEEFGDAENEPKSSPEHAETTTQEISALDDRDEEAEGASIPAATDDHNHRLQSNELTYENGYFQSNEVNFGLTHMQNKHIVNNASAKNDLIMDIGTMGNNQVSLALGLHHTEHDSKPIGNDGASSSSMVHDKLEYYYVDPVNNHENGFSSTHMLSDFVA